ncbi:hypothetical protein HYC85_023425 [Camellia sinensis]|uniref:Uncharacterized protein n=1 Tax=Camellia sinensis TaxID=4442 RepID=A0A7J7GIG2_CAMSI|nr:hypothetical protein HYC85_023425 [Camellia sinensis]
MGKLMELFQEIGSRSRRGHRPIAIRDLPLLKCMYIPPFFTNVRIYAHLYVWEQQLPEGSPLSCCQQKNPKLQLERLTTSIGLPMSVKQLQLEQQHEYPYPVEPPVKFVKLAADPQLVEQEQQSKFSNSGRPLELCAQEKAWKHLPMTSTTSLALPLNSEPPEQCKLDLPNS